MADIQSNEGLMAWIINQLGESLGEHAILKGGMVLRLLNCSRHTNDLDYVFIPYRSKKEVVPMIQKALQKLEGLHLEVRFYSTNANILATYQNFAVRIEISVAEHCLTEHISTSALANRYGLTSRVIPVMRFDESLAHKLAAWNERQLLRDLYDVAFVYTTLGEKPNRKILENRLSKINYAKKNKGGPKSMSMETFKKKLSTYLDSLSEKEVVAELRDTLPIEELPGLDKKIKVALKAIMDNL